MDKNIEEKLELIVTDEMLNGRISSEEADFVREHYESLWQSACDLDEKKKQCVSKYLIENYPEIMSCTDVVRNINHKSKSKFFIIIFSEYDDIAEDIFCQNNIETYIKKNILFGDNDNLSVYIISNEYTGKASVPKTRNDDYSLVKFRCDNAMRLLKQKGIEVEFTWYDLDMFCELWIKPYQNHVAVSYFKCKDGWAKEYFRKDLGALFRSTWEANIARVLNYKGVPWKYEAETIGLRSEGANSKISNVYIPDFVLEDGTILEIKGFWDARSKIKMQMVREQYPGRKIITIDADVYRGIKQIYENIVIGWEEDEVKTTNETIQVVGIIFPQRRPFVSKLKLEERLSLVREKENEYDANAIRVNDLEGNQIGYFAKDCASIYAPKMDMGFEYEIRVVAKQAKVLECRIKLLNSDEMILPEVFK